MRRLTQAQKKLLDEVARTIKDLVLVKELPTSTLIKLEHMNDYETLYQDADRYLADKFFAKETQ